MIITGVILALLGYWLLPTYVPEFPHNLDGLAGGIGVVLIVIGLILWLIGAIGGRTVGGRRYWY